MNNAEPGHRIARFLDASVEDLDPRVLRRLQAARERALERVRENETVLAEGSTASLGVREAFGPQGARVLVPATLLLLALIGLYAWQEMRQPPDLDETELLADDLPVNAYLDKGFQQWLSGSLQR